jgi:hypothetical protein
MSIDKNSFEYTKVESLPELESLLDKLSNFYSDNSLTPFINYFRTSNDTTTTIEFCECSDSGKFICFGGLMVNTETLYASLGYNSNNNYYIPVLDLVELFNNVLFDGKATLDKDNVLYIIETFKLDFKNFDIKGYIDSVLRELGNPSVDSFKSVVLRYVHTETDTSDTDEPQKYVYDLMDSLDILMGISFLLKNLNLNLSSLSYFFFGNFLVEANRTEVIQGSSFDTADLVSAKTYGGVKGYESLYLKQIKENGTSPAFARELSSLGFGLDRRVDILTSTTDDEVRDLALLSSGVYASLPKKSDLKKVDDTAIGIGNVLDLLRGIDSDQDLFFSYDMLISVGEDKYIKGLIKKLGLEQDIARIGNQAFVKGIKDYALSMLPLIDSGAVYGRRVAPDQKDFVTFSSREFITSGRLFKKVSDKILKKFST